MRLTSLLLAGVLLCVGGLGSDSPKEYDEGVTQLAQLSGAWRYVAYEAGGRRQKGFGTKTYGRGTFVYECNSPVAEGTFVAAQSRLDETYTHAQGRVLKCIYRIDGDILRIGYKLSGDERPRGFDDKQDLAIDTYERVK